MKVILLEDVPKVGRKYEEKEIPAGFARNFLLARGKAVLPNQFNSERLVLLRDKSKDESLQTQAEVTKMVETLPAEGIEIIVKASPEGHLFAGLKAGDIASILIEKYKLNLEPNLVHLDQPIKTLGDHIVKVGEKEIKMTIKAEE